MKVKYFNIKETYIKFTQAIHVKTLRQLILERRYELEFECHI